MNLVEYTFSVINRLDKMKPGARRQAAIHPTRGCNALRVGPGGAVLIWKTGKNHPVQVIGPERNTPARVTATWKSGHLIDLQLAEPTLGRGCFTGPMSFVRQDAAQDVWTLEIHMGWGPHQAEVAEKCFEILKRHMPNARLQLVRGALHEYDTRTNPDTVAAPFESALAVYA